MPAELLFWQIVETVLTKVEMYLRFNSWLILLLLLVSTSGCGRFVARRMVQAPNTYPTWIAPEPPVELAFDSLLLTNFPAHQVAVGPPEAQLHYRVIDPANFHLSISSTNWVERKRSRWRFTFQTRLPAETNPWTQSPRGTVVLLHGYGLAQFAMFPWALYLAEDGWRCVLVDLRGHGASTGDRIFFGIQETNDLSRLLDALARDGQLLSPVAAIGESYGAALSLRWKTVEPRLDAVVAVAPYASLSNATLNLGREYARWFPQVFLKAGLKQLPGVLKVEPGELNTLTVLNRSPVSALIVAGMEDKIMPPDQVQRVFDAAAPGSQLLKVVGASHEAVPYYFDVLGPPVKSWLDLQTNSAEAISGN
ncbi:MAG TPA: alpha/beta fold hydrolase [Verrucomicrobiae bacterium]|nr:alpha/beta fold hydrolase [Verrucomicrobiae bacterium]